MRRLAVLLFATAVFVLNPAFMCSEDAPRYQYGAAELNAAIAGTWSATIDGKTHTFRLEQERSAKPTQHSSASPSLVRAAAACGTRTLVASTSACVDSTEMPLTIIAVDGSAAPTRGLLLVHAPVFNEGHLHLSLASRTVTARIAPDGTLVDADVPMTHQR